MGFRFIDTSGIVQVAPDIGALKDALRDGRLTPDMPVVDEAIGTSLKAGALIAFHRKSAAVELKPGTTEASPIATRQPLRDRQPNKISPAPSVAVTASPDQESGHATRHRVMAWGLAIASIVALGNYASPTGLGEHIGRGLVLLLIAYFILKSIMGNDTDGRKIRLAWTLAVLWSIYTVLPIPFIVEGKNERAESERKAMQTLVDSSRSSLAQQEHAIKNDGTPASTPPAEPVAAVDNRSLLGKITPILQASNAQGVKELKDFMARYESLELEKVLEPATLTSRSGVDKNRERLTRYAELLESQVKRDENLSQQLHQKVVEAIGSGAEAEGFIVGFDSARKKKAVLYNASIEAQRAMIAEMRALNDFMANRVGTTVASGGVLTLSTDADLARYNELFGKVEAAGKRADAAAEAILASQREAIDKSEKRAKNAK